MKTMGLLGGMSWESSLEYYRIVNEEVKAKCGVSHSAKVLMYSFDFHEVEELQRQGDWAALTDLMVEQAGNLKKAGADFIVIGTNTMHLMADAIEERVGLKVLHIADVTGRKIKSTGLQKVALLGTKFTMEGSFYRDVLKERHAIDVLIPTDEDRQIIHDIIYNELVLGKFKSESKEKYKTIVDKLVSQGAEGVILGCTEIPLLIKAEDVSVPIFDTLTIHSKAAVDYALK